MLYALWYVLIYDYSKLCHYVFYKHRGKKDKRHLLLYWNGSLAVHLVMPITKEDQVLAISGLKENVYVTKSDWKFFLITYL